MKNNALLKWFLLILLSLIWGSSFILIKKGLTGFGFIEAATIRLMSAGLVALPFGLYHFRKIPRQKLPLVLVVSLLSMVIPAYLFCISQQNIQSSVAGILNALTPSFTFLFSMFFFKSKYYFLQVIGLVLGLVSSVFLVFAGSASSLSFNIYGLLIIGATVCYGLNINFVKTYLADVPSFSLSAVSVSFAGIIVFFLVFLPGQEAYQNISDQTVPFLALITLGVLGTALAQLLQNKIISISSSLFASTSTYIIPIVAILWGVVDNEAFSVRHLISMAGILTAIIFIRMDKNPFGHVKIPLFLRKIKARVIS